MRHVYSGAVTLYINIRVAACVAACVAAGVAACAAVCVAEAPVFSCSRSV